MKNSGDQNPLDLRLDVIGGGSGKWDLRVSISPLVRGIRLSGATVSLFGPAGERLGATVVVPCDGLLHDDAVYEVVVGGDDLESAGQVLACCELRIEGELSPVVAERRLCAPSSFSDFVSGQSVLKCGAVASAAALEGDELSRLRAALAGPSPAKPSAMVAALQPAVRYKPAPDASPAFDAFSKDFMDTFGLDPDDELTEDLLKLIQES